MKKTKVSQNKTESDQKAGQEKQKEFSFRPSLSDLAKGWSDFSPVVPLSFSVDARRAAKLKNS